MGSSEPIQMLSGVEIRNRDKLSIIAQVEKIGRLPPEDRKTANDMLLGDMIQQLCKPKG